MIITCSNDERVKLWSADLEPIETLQDHTAFIFSVKSFKLGHYVSGGRIAPLKSGANRWAPRTLHFPVLFGVLLSILMVISLLLGQMASWEPSQLMLLDSQTMMWSRCSISRWENLLPNDQAWARWRSASWWLRCKWVRSRLCRGCERKEGRVNTCIPKRHEPLGFHVAGWAMGKDRRCDHRGWALGYESWAKALSWW